MSANDDWPYFVHCTRATIGPWPHESEYSFRQRVWSQADSIVWQPLETLAKICRDGRLCATATITRTDARSVSFSAVPLVPLLEGRTFRAHLGRWDWEPYGLMIRREVLQAVGAVKVLYGDEADYADLSVEKKPYFQPRASQRGGRLIDWTVEREWRVVGDVWLSRLPADSVLLFVRSQIEAEQLARYASWPVLWVQ